MTKQMSEHISKQMSDHASQHMLDVMRERMSEANATEHMSHFTAGQLSEHMPQSPKGGRTHSRKFPRVYAR